ncbi:MAG: hypothetical protein BM564_11945 [Bacteroidetes bacterium MedPE-SWsnd-G2]|nr:MAG: hypothetical protein BM564_11945 [Bacteroidetes bacterium MedPE-SWsnd-G2]
MTKKLLFFMMLFVSFALSYAQDDAPDDAPKEGWTKTGKTSILFNQSSFSNWTAGGDNSLSGTFGLNYDFNYVKGKWSWDNKLIASYGISKNSGEDYKKTDDRLEFNSTVGSKFKEHWYYSGFVNFKTQFDSGIDDDTDKQISHFFSPAYLQFGLGLLWKKNDNLKVNFAPATGKMIFVHSEFTDPLDPDNNLDSEGKYFGVDAGDSSRFEFGFAINSYFKFEVMENVSVENILNLYSNYLEDPQNVDIDYTLNVVMSINKWLSANLAFQAIYDDNAFRGFQIREVFGVGLNYGF